MTDPNHANSLELCPNCEQLMRRCIQLSDALAHEQLWEFAFEDEQVDKDELVKTMQAIKKQGVLQIGILIHRSVNGLKPVPKTIL